MINTAKHSPVETITNRDRLDVLNRYRTRISELLRDGEHAAALALLFDLDEELGRRHERRLVAFSAESRALLDDDVGKDEAKGRSPAFQRRARAILDVIEREALEDIFDDTEDSTVDFESDPAFDDAASGESLQSVKRRIQAKSLAGLPPTSVLSGISHYFVEQKSHFRLDDISMEIRAGQVVAVVGRNGSGKTTLLRIISADLAPKLGTVTFPALTTSCDADDWRRLRARIAFIPSKLASWPHRVDTFMQMTGMAYGLSYAECARRCDALLHRYGLARFRNTGVSRLSIGYRLRVEIARCMMMDPALLVLDEPLANLDAVAQGVVLDDLRSLATSVQAPCSIVVSSHHIRAIEAISDDVVILSESGQSGQAETDEPSSIYRVRTDDSARLRALGRELGVARTISDSQGTILIFPGVLSMQDLTGALFNHEVAFTGIEELTGSAEAALLIENSGSGRRGQA